MIGVAAIVRELARLRSDALEVAAEKMLASPVPCGIAVITDDIINLDNLEGAMTWECLLDAKVPFGHIYEFPSKRAYEDWREGR